MPGEMAVDGQERRATQVRGQRRRVFQDLVRRAEQLRRRGHDSAGPVSELCAALLPPEGACGGRGPAAAGVQREDPVAEAAAGGSLRLEPVVSERDPC